MQSRLSRTRLEALTLEVCEALLELSQRNGNRQQFITLASVQAYLGLADDELEAVIAFGLHYGVLERASGWIAVHKRHLQIDLN